MHTLWKSRERVHEVFATFWVGGIVKILVGGYTFLVFYCIFINKFCKNFREGTLLSTLSPPPPHPPPMCASMKLQQYQVGWYFILSLWYFDFDQNKWGMKNSLLIVGLNPRPLSHGSYALSTRPCQLELPYK